MTTILRDDRVAFKFSGEDATHFLQDVLTCTVTPDENAPSWYALLTPQGKIIAEGIIGFHDGSYFLDVDMGVADQFFKRMRMYKLRANVEIESLADTHALGWSLTSDGEISHKDPRSSDLGYRVITPKDQAVGWQTSNAYASALINAGFAEMGFDYAGEEIFPHDIGMDILKGIDFAKGCFVGQEVVSRMKHRGTARRRPIIVSSLPMDAKKLDSVFVNGKVTGTLGNVVNSKAIALLRIDRIIEEADAFVNEQPVVLTLPSWANYTFAEQADLAES